MGTVSARERLIGWIAHDEQRTIAFVGRSLGVSAAAVSQWLSGKNTPAHDMRGALEILTGIPATDWVTPEERERAERACALATAARDLLTNPSAE